MSARFGLALSLALLLPLFGCTDFPVIEAGVCGNAVIDREIGEDCDSFAPRGQACRPPGVVDACHFDCRTVVDGVRAECPEDMGCDDDGICRKPNGTFEDGVNFAPGVSSWLSTADFDGDGRRDVISTEAADEQRQARFRIHYFDSDAKLEATRTFPRVVSRPVARRLTGRDAADDLVFSTGLIGMVPGRADREWVPAAFSSYVLPGTRLRAVSLRTIGKVDAIGLAIFSDLDEGPGVYIPSIDNRQLLRRAPLRLPFEQLAEPTSADLVTGPDSPCTEVVFAFLGDDAVHVLDLCARGSKLGDPEVVWRDKAVEQVVHLPKGATVTTAPQTADLDGDGHLDILVGSGDQTFAALGDGTTLEATASQVMLPSLKDGSMIPLFPPLASGDITGDGVVDFVLPIGILGSYTSLIDGRLGYFEGYRNSAKPWTTATVADLNGNGLLDVIAASEGAPGLSFLSGTGGPFQNLTQLSTQGPLRFLSVGDFDGDRVFDAAYVQSGPSPGANDSLAVAFGKRDSFPSAESLVAQVAGVRQLGAATQNGGSSLFTVSRDEVDGVTRSKFTLFDGSPERLPFAPYSLVTFSVNGSLQDSLARVLAVGAFVSTDSTDLFALGGSPDPLQARTWSMWLAPDIGGAEKPPQRLVIDVVPDDAFGVTFKEQGGQLSAAAIATDLERDGFDEALLLMQRGERGEGCYLLIYDLDAVNSTATSKGILTFDEACPDPELATADVDGDTFPDLVVLIGDAKLGPRQLRVLFNDGQGGFSLDESASIGVDGEDVRGVSIFADGSRLAFVTDRGLYVVQKKPYLRKFGRVSFVQRFNDTRSVVVTNPDGDNVEDLAVADAAGVWLLKAHLQ